MDNHNSSSKEKEDPNKLRNSIQILPNKAISSKQNCFLNYNKVHNNTEKKNSIHNSINDKPIPALKLFDDKISSSDSDSDSDEENEDDEKESSDIKYENLGDNRNETELVMDSTFKISDDELSNELNECDAEKDHRKKSLIEKKLLLSSKNISIENDVNREIKQSNKKSEKIDISCKNMTSRLYLATNKNKISNFNNNIILSSVITIPGILDEKEKINQDSYFINSSYIKIIYICINIIK